MAQPVCWLTGLSHPTPNIIPFIIWISSVKADFEYQLGDLVSFTDGRITEDYIDEFVTTGIVIKQRFVFTADNKFLVQTPERNYWVSRPALTLLSRAQNKT
tara:strand:- start:1822 stop:2124 length:303 start_codon:yes stop_codon:yes gene_type:complete